MVSKKYKVAVLISLYKNDNEFQFMESLLSILNQDYGEENIRVYLGVDGPISMTLENCINEYKDRIYKVVKSKDNIGLAGILNKLILELENERFIFRMDSDDISYVDRFSKQVNFLEEHPEVSIVGGSIKEFSESENYTRIKKYKNCHKLIVSSIHKGTAFAHPTVCFRKEALTVLKEYSAKYPLNEDIELWYRAISKGLILANLSDVLLDFRINDTFYSRRSIVKSINELKAYIWGIRLLKKRRIYMVYPFVRFLFRLLPKCIIKKVYQSNIRFKLL